MNDLVSKIIIILIVRKTYIHQKLIFNLFKYLTDFQKYKNIQLTCRNWRVKVLTSFVYIVESAILHLARFKFRMNRLVREIARLAVVANPVSIYVPDTTTKNKISEDLKVKVW